MPLPLQRHDAAIAAALGLLVFVVRWLILDFDNEYFMHVAWAAEMIRGGRPVYDFVEPGFILQTTIAYLAMLAGGPQLAVEGVLVCALLATATVATFLVCRSLGIPRWMAVVASLAAAATCPRLYAYPKVLVYPLAILAIVSYARHPSRRWLVALAAMTAISFLFRHDHGVYVGVYMSLSLIALHLGGSRSAPLARSLREYAALSLLMISPWVAWVALSGTQASTWTSSSDGPTAWPKRTCRIRVSRSIHRSRSSRSARPPFQMSSSAGPHRSLPNSGAHWNRHSE